MIEHSKEYYRILKQTKQWPKWKIDVYNQYVAVSAHAKKIEGGLK